MHEHVPAPWPRKEPETPVGVEKRQRAVHNYYQLTSMRSAVMADHHSGYAYLLGSVDFSTKRATALEATEGVHRRADGAEERDRRQDERKVVDAEFVTGRRIATGGSQLQRRLPRQSDPTRNRAGA